MELESDNDHFEAFREYEFELIHERLRVGLLSAAVLAALVFTVVWAMHTQIPTWHIAWAGGLSIGGTLATAAVFWLKGTFGRLALQFFLVASGALVMNSLAFLSVPTGGFSSPILYLLPAVWAFGLVVIEGPPMMFVAGVLSQSAGIAVTLSALGAPLQRSAIADLVPLGATFAFFTYAATVRRNTSFRLYVAQQELSELRSKAERTVVERSKQVDELSVQLQQKVENRSRALARALHDVATIDLAPGHVVDHRVEIIRLLGRGGMGAVYLATDLLTSGLVAVKLMYPAVSNAMAIRRFLTEAEVVSRVSDPGIVQTKHIDVSEEGYLYQVMEYVEGASLHARLRLGPRMLPGECARIGAAIAHALSSANDAGIVHRDIKPANIMLSHEPPGVRILDFGISKLTAQEDGTQLTDTGQTMGTPAYMSPEQVRQTSTVTAATDVYSLGIVLFEMLSGHLPFLGGVGELFVSHLTEPAPDVRKQADVPDVLAQLVERCLHKDAQARPSARELHAELERIASDLDAPPADVINRKCGGAMVPVDSEDGTSALTTQVDGTTKTN